MMVNLPQYYMVVSGMGEGKYPLLAFDNALRDAGIGDFNLVKVSSILPPGCTEKDYIDLEAGSIIYAAYSMDTVTIDQEMTLAVAVAIPRNEKENGVIFESSSDSDDAEIEVTEMCKMAMQNRSRSAKEIKSSSIRIVGKKDTYVCGISAVIMW